MGGFFLSNDPQANALAQAHFARLNLPQTQLQVGSYSLCLLQKKYVRGHRNWFEGPTGMIGGVGFWIGESASGERALPAILDSIGTNEAKLADLTGHAAFVFEKSGEVGVVADRTGHYPVYLLREGALFAVSSSLLALANVASRLSFNRQAVLEFVNLEAVLGTDTVFDQITCLKPGTIVSLPLQAGGAISTRRYHTPREVGGSDAEIQSKFIRHFERLKLTELGPGDICCDLSGGYDSRTVAALMHAAGVAHTLNTNVNRLDPGDHEAALAAAMQTGRPITLYNVVPEQEPDLDELFWHLDVARNLSRGKLTTLTMELKASRHALLLGGYGGELFRDIYSRRRSIRELIELDYCRGLAPTKYDRVGYIARLHDKLSASLDDLGYVDDAHAAERLYLFEKMRAWGGSRIALYNRFTHHFHPLMDYHVQRHVLTVPGDAKVAAAFQRQIIGLDAALAAAPYTTSRKQAMNSRPRTLLNRLTRVSEIPGRLKKVLAAAKPKTQEAVPMRYQAALKSFEDVAGLTLDACNTSDHRGRALTLVHTFLQYESKF